MRSMFVDGLLAGVAAAVIWMAGAMMAGLSTNTIGLFALVMLVGTCLLVTVVGGFIRSRVEEAHAQS